MTQLTTIEKPLVDLDELGSICGRAKSLAFALQLVMSGSGVPNGHVKECVMYDLAALIEDLSGRAEKLVGDL